MASRASSSGTKQVRRARGLGEPLYTHPADLSICSSDIVCLQETKLTPERVSPAQAEYLHVEGWDSYHCIGVNGGYCGIATYVRRGAGGLSPPQAAYTNVRQYLDSEAGLSDEGRLLVTDHGTAARTPTSKRGGMGLGGVGRQ